MDLCSALDAYLAALKVPRDKDAKLTPHQEQAVIVLPRFVEWLKVPRESRVPGQPARVVTEASQLASQDLIEFIAYRSQQRGRRKGSQISAQTLNKEIRYIRLFIGHMDGDRSHFELPDNWQKPKVKREKTLKKKPKFLTTNLLERVFESCAFATRPKLPSISAQDWMLTLFYVNYVTSMRCRALFSFPRPPEEDLETRLLNVAAEYDKSGEDRVYPLTPLAVHWIRKMPARPGETMFVWDAQCPGCKGQGRLDNYTTCTKCSGSGRSDNLRTFYRHLHWMQEQAGIPEAQHGLPHVLRKTTATHMLMEGVDRLVVQRQLGHTDQKILEQHYIGVVTEAQRDGVDTLYVPAAIRRRDKQLKLFD